jgi:hypothetical protein
MQEALITFAEGMTVLLDRGRRNGWVAEARVMLEVGRTTLRDIATRSVVAIMEALLVDSADRGWWRRIVDGLWVRTAGEQQRRSEQSQGGEFHQELLQCCLRASVKERACRKRHGWREKLPVDFGY